MIAVSPCGIALRVNNYILVESVFHGAKGAKAKPKSEILISFFAVLAQP